MTDEDDLIAALRARQAAERGYADFDAWPDRDIRDIGLGHDFIDALRSTFNIDLPAPVAVPAGSVPPDLISGSVGIELTELVDTDLVRTAARHKRAGTRVHLYRDWSQEQLVTRLGEIVARKDRGRPKHDTPYADYWLVVHTAEPGIDPSMMALYLKAWNPPVCKLLTRAFVLMSYFPDFGGRPLFELPLRTAA